MARLIGIGLLLWAVFLSIEFALKNAPRAPVAGAVVTDAAPEGPTDTDLPIGPGPPTTVRLGSDRRPAPVIEEPSGRPWVFGVYEVGDSPDPIIAARDRDHRPRVPLFEREGLEGEPGIEQGRPTRGVITPGLYATSFDAEGCSYELWRVLEDGRTWLIGEDYLSAGRLMVTINGVEPDWFVSSVGCARWYEWTPLGEPLTEAGDGDYWIGDLASGPWIVPEPCRWEKVVAFRGGFLLDVVEAGSGPGAMAIDEETLGLRVRGCRSPMTRLSTVVSVAVP